MAKLPLRFFMKGRKMINDKIIAYAYDENGEASRPLYDNAPSVAVLAVVRCEHLLVIKRNTDPGKGLWALPGGYHMRGETWQEAAIREFQEETGNELYKSETVKLIDVNTDHYDNNVIIGVATISPSTPIYLNTYNKKEVQNVRWMNLEQVENSVGFWAFATHYDAAVKALT